MNLNARKMSQDELSILNVTFGPDEIIVEISDGRTVSTPLAWFPRLASATPKQLDNYEISPSGYGIHWPDLDEDISVKSILG